MIKFLGFVDRVPADHPNSRYKFVREIVTPEGNFLDLPKFESIPDQVFIYHKVSISEAGRLDKISYYYYRTTDFYWVIALVNRIQNPLDLPVGTQLKIPSLPSIFGEQGVL